MDGVDLVRSSSLNISVSTCGGRRGTILALSLIHKASARSRVAAARATTMAFFIACVSSLVLLFLLFLSRYLFQLLGSSRLPPGPLPLPVIGNLLDVAALTGRHLPHRSLARLAARHGPLMTLRLGRAVVIFVSSPDAAREVLHTHNASLAGRIPPDAWHGAGHAANSVFVLPPHHKWRSLRRIGTEHLLSPRRLDGLRPVRLLQDAVVSHVSSELAAEASSGVLVVGHVASAATVDMLWQAMFGCQVELDASAATSAYRELHGLARDLGAIGLTPNVSDFFPVLAAADLQGVRRSFARKLGRLYQLIDVQIQRQRRHRRESAAAASGGGCGKNGGLLDAMLDMSDEDDGAAGGMNNDTIRAFLADLLLAAIETIPNAIEWAMAELLQNPNTMRRLKEELRSVSGGKTHVDYSDMDHLPFLRAVIKETLRLHTLVPFVPNKADAVVRVHGYTIPKGSTVIVNVWAIHHDAEVWPEPDTFIPGRFVGGGNNEVHFLGADLQFIPFNAGRRICLGLPLASRMLHAMLATLLHRFEWVLPPGVAENGVDMSEKIGMTMSMANPLKAIPKPICMT